MADPILFLDHAPALGGAEVSLLLLLKRLSRERWQPHLACAGGPLAEKAVASGVPIHILPMPRLRHSPRALLDWLKGIQTIARLVRHIGARALVANTVRAAFYTAPAARLTGIPFVWYMRDFWLSEERPRHLWADRLGKRFLCAAAARIIANSHATGSRLPCRNTTIIPNGIEVEQYDPAMDGKPLRERFGIPSDVPLVGTVGRLRPWKGQDRFLRVVARVQEAVPDACGLVVGGTPLGEGEEYPALLYQMTRDLGLAGRIIFTGHLEDVRPALAAMDIFVHPGDPEPFGLVNIEAMAMAKPVVAFAHGALPEIVIDGETGILVAPEDEAAMAQAVLSLLRDPSRSVAIGHRGATRVREHFAAERMAEQVAAVLREIVG